MAIHLYRNKKLDAWNPELQERVWDLEELILSRPELKSLQEEIERGLEEIGDQPLKRMLFLMKKLKEKHVELMSAMNSLRLADKNE